MTSFATRNIKSLKGIQRSTDPGFIGFWPDETPATKLLKFRDRAFFGDGAEFSGTLLGSQGGFLPSPTDGANWAVRDAILLGASRRGLMAVVGYASNQNSDLGAGKPTENIGVAGFAKGAQATRSSHALYGDLQFEAGTFGYGAELALKNKTGVSFNTDPFLFNFKVAGLWLVPGGDPSYGGAANANVDVGIAFGGSGTLGTQFNRGIVFKEDSINGTDGVTGTGVAISFAKGHELVWRNFGGPALIIRGNNSTGAATVTLESLDSVFRVAGFNGNDIVRMQHTASAVNSTRFINAATGNLVTWEAQGSDAVVGIQIRTVGAGSVRFQSHGSTSFEEFRVGGLNVNPVNFLWAYGSAASAGVATIQAAGADSSVDVYLFPKGTNGRVRFGTFTSSSDVPITGSVEMRDSTGVLRKLAVIA